MRECPTNFYIKNQYAHHMVKPKTKEMAMYEEIKEFVRKKYGFNVKSCYIAHVKEMCGFKLKKAPNRTEYNYRKYPCPTHKVDAIKDAFKHFKMI